MSRIPQNKQELLESIEQEWALLMQLVESLTAEQMIAPDAGGWSPKDNLAHLAEWMNILMGYHMDKRPAHEVIGVAEEVTRGWNAELINPVLFERNKNRTGQEAIGYVQETYQKLIARLKATTFEELMRPRHADDPQKRPLLLWVLGNTSEHFQEHHQTIEKGI